MADLSSISSSRAPSALRGAVVLLLLGSLGAEAGLIRGGGRGSQSVITDATAAGTVPYLVPDPDPDDNNTQYSPASALPVVSDATAAYGFGPLGRPLSIEHNYGRACSRDIQCSFALGRDEALSWDAVLLGLPGDNPPIDYLALAGLTIEWEFRAIEAPPPGFSTTGPRPSRELPGLSWSQTFTPDGSGSYLPGAGSAAVQLGPDLGYLPAGDELSGCFGLQSPESALAISEFYAYGPCRLVGLDLSLLGPDGLTGSDLLTTAALAPNEYLSLFVTAELNAPEDFQFANLYLEGGDLGLDAIVPGADVATPASILASVDGDPGDLRYLGCAAVPDSACDRVITNSQGLRVNVVPSPGPISLLMGGLLGLLWQRRASRRTRG